MARFQSHTNTTPTQGEGGDFRSNTVSVAQTTKLLFLVEGQYDGVPSVNPWTAEKNIY